MTPQGMSYVSGASEKPLLGLTIGAQLDRTAARHPDNEALVVPHQGVRWRYGDLRREGRRARRGDARAGAGARRPPRHLVAQQQRVGADPVRRGQGRAGPGQHQPRLPPGRARIRAQQGRVPGAGHRRGLQVEPLHRDAAHAGAGARRGPPRRAQGREAAASGDGRPPRRRRDRRHVQLCRGAGARGRGRARAIARARGRAAVRRPHQHPVHQRHHGLPQGGHAEPPQHPQQRLLQRRDAPARRAPTGSASRCRSTTASAWSWAT